MSHIDADRVLSTSTTTGAGDVAIDGSVSGYRSLGSLGLADGDTVDLYVEEVLPATGVPTGAWESGTYTWRGGVLERTTIRGSSNGGAPVSWGVGVRRIGMGMLAYMVARVRALPQTYEDARASLAAEVAADREAVADDLTSVQALAAATSGDAAQTAADRAATGADRSAVADDRVAVGTLRLQAADDAQAAAADRVQTGQDRAAVAADRVQTGQDRAATGADRTQTSLDRAATGADRVQTGADRAATGADRAAVAADRSAAEQAAYNASVDRDAVAADRSATTSDRAQTGMDRAATAADRVQTTQDAAATTADRIAVAADRSAADAAAASAVASAVALDAGVAQAGASAATAGAAASQALAIYGSNANLNAAQQIMLGLADTAANQAALAVQAAAAASSVAQQDLSGTQLAALHRSPNAVVAAILYDTSRDSDGGAWVEKCADKSWARETLMGTWLGQHASEMDARDYFGSLGAQSLVTGDSSTFTNGVGAWTAQNNCTISAVGGNLRAVATASTSEVRVTLSVATVAGQRYQVRMRKKSGPNKNVFIYVGTAAGSNNLVNVNTSWASLVGDPSYASFVATGTSTFVTLAGSSVSVAGDVYEFDDVTVTPVDLSKNPSGAYYQDTTDGKFKRLWKNLLPNSVWAGGTSGVEGSGAVAPSGWAFSTGTGSVTFLASTYNPGANAIRFQANGERPYVSAQAGSTTALVGTTYTVSCRVEAVAAASNIGNLLTFTGSGLTSSSAVYKANGATVTAAYTPVAGDLIEYSFTVSGAGGPISARVGPGASNVSTSDVTLSSPQVEVTLPNVASTAYESKTGTDSSQSETFRGNKSKFPRLAAVVAEASRVVIYDLTEPGRPMWMVFQRSSVSGVPTHLGTSTNNISSAAAREAVLAVGGSNSGVITIDFLRDVARYRSASSVGLRAGNIARRNAELANVLEPATGLIANEIVNAVAMTTLPDAPVDPVTGLQVPTIAVATNGGVSVIKHDGSVCNSSSTVQFTKVEIVKRTKQLLGTWGGGETSYMFGPVGEVATSFGFKKNLNSLLPPYVNTNGAIQTKLQDIGAGRFASINSLAHKGVTLLCQNGYSQDGLAAYITSLYNTGWMVGDARRAWLADVSAGTVSAANLVVNGGFDTAAGWTLSAGSSIDGGTLNFDGVTDKANGTTLATSAAQITLEAGYYSVTYTITANTTNHISMSVGGLLTAAQNTAGTYTETIGPLANAVNVSVAVVTRNQGGIRTGGVDNIVLTPMVVDRSAKAKPLTINGTLAKTAVAAAAQLVAYAGFTNDAAWVTTELVINGTFATDISGWTSNSTGTGTIAWEGASPAQTLKITSVDGSNRGSAYQAVTTVPGRWYTYGVTLVNTAGGWVERNNLRIGSFVGGADLSGVIGFASTGQRLTGVFKAVGTLTYIQMQAPDQPASGFYDDISVKALTAAGSAANVLQEPYSADLDPGTGPLRVAALATLPASLTAAMFVQGSELITNGTFAAGSTGWTASGGTIDASSGQAVITNAAGGGEVNVSNGPILSAGKWYLVSVNAVSATGGARGVAILGTSRYTLSAGANAFFALCTTSSSFQLGTNSATAGYSITVDDVSVKELTLPALFDRSGPTGTYYRMYVQPDGKLVAEVYDGTTTRTVTTPAAYNTGLPFSVAMEYVAGKLGIVVNGREVASATGTPLLTLNNASAVATVGNSRTLDAAWPGSIALVKVGMTVPTADASAWMYEQEKQMFQPGAQITLPDAGAIVDIDYDAATDQILVASAANEATFNGLVRTATQPAQAGSISKVAAAGGAKLIARTGTLPGVDVTLPSMNLKEQLLRRAEDVARAGRTVEGFDWTAGFTANTHNTVNPNALQGVSPATNGWPGTIHPFVSTTVGAQISGAGIPAGTIIVAMEGTTVIRLSGNASAAGTAVPISFTDYILPLGYEARDVMVDGALKQEGTTKAYTKLFDGFRERIRFNTAPSASAWVRVNARRAA